MIYQNISIIGLNKFINKKTNDNDAKQFLKIIFNFLNKKKINYCVERNYEKYPKKITGDVDLILDKKKIKSVSNQIIKIAKKNGWLLYQKNITNINSYTSFVKKNFPNRFVFTLEIYSDASWKGFNYLDGDKILKEKIKYKNLFKPSALHEAVITFFHHYLYNFQVPAKYRKKILKLILQDTYYFKQFLKKFFFGNLPERIYENIVNKNWKYFDHNLAKRLRIQIILKNIFFNPFLSLIKIINGIYFRFNRPQGILIILNGKKNSVKNQIMMNLLNINYKWHICLPPEKKIIDDKNAFTKKISKIINSGGFVILNSNRETKNFETLISKYPSYLININKKNLILYLGKKNQYIHIKNNNIKKMSYYIWYKILVHYSRRK